jgi:hypothetical protein
MSLEVTALSLPPPNALKLTPDPLRWLLHGTSRKSTDSDRIAATATKLYIDLLASLFFIRSSR